MRHIDAVSGAGVQVSPQHDFVAVRTAMQAQVGSQDHVAASVGVLRAQACKISAGVNGKEAAIVAFFTLQPVARLLLRTDGLLCIGLRRQRSLLVGEVAASPLQRLLPGRSGQLEHDQHLTL